jgi:hypothetical protein
MKPATLADLSRSPSSHSSHRPSRSSRSLPRALSQPPRLPRRSAGEALGPTKTSPGSRAAEIFRVWRSPVAAIGTEEHGRGSVRPREGIAMSLGRQPACRNTQPASPERTIAPGKLGPGEQAHFRHLRGARTKRPEFSSQHLRGTAELHLSQVLAPANSTLPGACVTHFSKRSYRAAN